MLRLVDAGRAALQGDRDEAVNAQVKAIEATAGKYADAFGRAYLAEVLVGGARAGRAQGMLVDMEAIGIRIADVRDGEPLRLANLRAASRLTLPGCCALDVAMSTGSTLATFDEALAEAARQRHVKVAPEPGLSRAAPGIGLR